jgi:hypothetical protein
VDEIKDMKGVLINFAHYYNHENNLIIRINEEPQIFMSKAYIPEERKSGLGILKTSKYIQLVDNDIRASLHHIVVESDNSVLKEFHNLG